MSADKRTVSTDALETLGTIIGPEQKRDAIHLAVIPVEAGENLYASQDVYLLDGKAYKCGRHSKDALGIVDPFLSEIAKGRHFWLVIYPRVITSLRHVWTHPNLPDEAGVSAPVIDKTASENWLRKWIANADCPDYDTVIAAATGRSVKQVEGYGPAYELNNYGKDKYLFFSGRDAHSDIPPEFWTHLEIVTGETIPADMRATSFSCSC